MALVKTTNRFWSYKRCGRAAPLCLHDLTPIIITSLPLTFGPVCASRKVDAKKINKTPAIFRAWAFSFNYINYSQFTDREETKKKLLQKLLLSRSSKFILDTLVALSIAGGILSYDKLPFVFFQSCRRHTNNNTWLIGCPALFVSSFISLLCTMPFSIESTYLQRVNDR